jgi:hypothetical protein
MRKVTAAVMASTLAFSAFSQAAEAIISDNGPSQEGATQHSSQSHMFDGISLTEHQRQQMRDLMQRATTSPLLMLAKWRQCIALSPQKILTKALCALRPKNGTGTGCSPGRDGEGPQPDVPPANAGAASGFEHQTSAAYGSAA